LGRRLLDPDAVYRGADGFLLHVDPGDGLQVLMLLGIYDQEVLGVLRDQARTGTTVIDAGAHFGYFSLQAARCVGPQGRVLSFEPDPRLAPRLREHIRLNDLAQVSAVEEAVSESAGEMRLRLPGPLGHSTLRADPLHESGEEATVRTVALDDHLEAAGVAPESVSVIKLDVEGGEASALRGMQRTLERSRAGVIVEVDPARSKRLGADPAEVFELLARTGREPARLLSGRGGGEITATALRSGSTEGVADVLFLPGRDRAQASSR
jgi:FkbM family methyltransferase